MLGAKEECYYQQEVYQTERSQMAKERAYRDLLYVEFERVKKKS